MYMFICVYLLNVMPKICDIFVNIFIYQSKIFLPNVLAKDNFYIMRRSVNKVG